MPLHLYEVDSSLKLYYAVHLLDRSFASGANKSKRVLNKYVVCAEQRISLIDNFAYTSDEAFCFNPIIWPAGIEALELNYATFDLATLPESCIALSIESLQDCTDNCVLTDLARVVA